MTAAAMADEDSPAGLNQSHCGSTACGPAVPA